MLGLRPERRLEQNPEPALPYSTKAYWQIQYIAVTRKADIIAIAGIALMLINFGYALGALYPPLHVYNLIIRTGGTLVIATIVLLAFYIFTKSSGTTDIERVLKSNFEDRRLSN